MLGRAVKELKNCVSVSQMQGFQDTKLSDYRYQIFGNTYGDVKQEWLLIFSEKAYQREAKSLAKYYLKKSLLESKSLVKLCQKTFACQQDAANALQDFQKACQYISINHWQIQKIEGYTSRGKPKKGRPKVLKGFQIQASLVCKKETYEKQKDTLGLLSWQVMISNKN